MGSVGNFGNISFYCTSVNGRGSILSFSDLQRSASASYSEHERFGKKPYLEYTADGLDELSLAIIADAVYGIRPLEVQNLLFDAKENAQAENFVLGGVKIGRNPFVITGITQIYQVLNYDGRPVKINFNLNLKEYVNQTANISTVAAASSVSDPALTTAAIGSDTYTVVKGDCLWNIAKSYYGSGSQYTKIYNANKDIIDNPNLIYPGQTLTIPR